MMQPAFLPQQSTIELWRANLDAPPFSDLFPLEVLSADERTRLARFKRALDRERYGVGRVMLRLLLGHYCGANPADLAFDYGPQGKPRLAQRYQYSSPSIHFNVAHSETNIVYAVATRAVGIDIEVVRALDDLDDLISHYFVPQEQQVMRSADGEQRLDLFYRGWTRKEAWLKLLGDGLMRDPTTFAVGLTDKPRLLWFADTQLQTEDWSLIDLKPERRAVVGDVVGALAVQGTELDIRRRDLAELR